MDSFEKLTILADGAKYDASGAGICHSWSADGRCISLLKVLMTNRCVYDCEYCVNRRTADVARVSS